MEVISMNFLRLVMFIVLLSNIAGIAPVFCMNSKPAPMDEKPDSNKRKALHDDNFDHDDEPATKGSRHDNPTAGTGAESGSGSGNKPGSDSDAGDVKETLDKQKLAQELREIKQWFLEYIEIPEDHASLLNRSGNFKDWMCQCLRDRETYLWKQLFDVCALSDYSVDKMIADHQEEASKKIATDEKELQDAKEMIKFDDGDDLQTLFIELASLLLSERSIDPKTIRFVITDKENDDKHLSTMQTMKQALILCLPGSKAIMDCMVKDAGVTMSSSAFYTSLFAGVVPHEISHLKNQDRLVDVCFDLLLKRDVEPHLTDVSDREFALFNALTKKLYNEILRFHEVRSDIEGCLWHPKFLTYIIDWRKLQHLSEQAEFFKMTSSIHPPEEMRVLSCEKIKRVFEIDKLLA